MLILFCLDKSSFIVYFQVKWYNSPCCALPLQNCFGYSRLFVFHFQNQSVSTKILTEFCKMWDSYQFSSAIIINNHKLDGFKEISSFPVLEAISAKLRCQQPHSLSVGSRELCFPALSQFLLITGNPRSFWACQCILTVFASIFTWHYSCVFASLCQNFTRLMRSSVTLDLGFLHFNLIVFPNTLLPNKAIFTGSKWT